MKMISPCKDCLLVPTCQNKDVIDMFITCTNVVNFLFEDSQSYKARPDYMERVQKVEESLGKIMIKESEVSE